MDIYMYTDTHTVNYTDYEVPSYPGWKSSIIQRQILHRIM